MRQANERRRYIVTSSLIGWAHAQNYPCLPHGRHGLTCLSFSINTIVADNRADSRLAPSQSETSLQSDAVSHWLGAYLESAL